MEQRPALFVFKINGQGAFVAMQILLIRAATTAGHRIAVGILTRRRLNFNDIGTPIRQQSNRHWPSPSDGQI
jgi:hypothetical protein